MQAEILMIGTELLLGQIVDTNASWLGQTLADHGINLYQKTTVGDNRQRIERCLDNGLNRADVILTSGGLGPTEDDLTREAIAEVLDRPLETHPDLLERLEMIFSMINRPMTENNKKQATLPRGAQAIENPNGTAPGILVEDERGIIISMPGVPHELKPMTEDFVLPYLKEKFGLAGVLRSRVLKVAGMGESRVDEAIGDIIRGQENPTVGVLASPDVVRIRITARADDPESAARMIEPVEAGILERLPGRVYGADEDTLEGVVDGLLKARDWTLAVGETSSGGVVLQRMSFAECEQFAGGFVLGRAEYTTQSTAAGVLARRAMETTGATCGLGIGFEPADDKTHVAFVWPGGEESWELKWPLRDKRYQTRVGVTAIDLVRRHLIA